MMPPSLPLFAFLRATRREQLFIAVTFRRISLWKWHHEVDVDWGGITCLSFPTHDRHDLQLTLHRSARSGRRCTTTRSAVVRRGTYLATYGEDGVLWSPEGHYRSPPIRLSSSPKSSSICQCRPVHVHRYTCLSTVPKQFFSRNLYDSEVKAYLPNVTPRQKGRHREEGRRGGTTPP